MVAVEPVKERPFPAPPPVVALIVAVGVPSLIPVTANSADEVALLPRRKSETAVYGPFGWKALLDMDQLLPAPAAQSLQEGIDAPDIKQRPVEAVVA